MQSMHLGIDNLQHAAVSSITRHVSEMPGKMAHLALQVAEELLTWDHESLLTEIASALNAERNDMYPISAVPGQQVAV